MKKRILWLLVPLAVCLTLTASALAQDYSFQLTQEVVNVSWNQNGTMAMDYVFTFNNDSGAPPIDYVDVGLPNANYDISSIAADVNGNAISDIQPSTSLSSGVTLGLGDYSIPAGATGTVHVSIPQVTGVLYPDSSDSSYASAVFSPTWFSSQYVHGSTTLTVIFHLPPGVQPQEPRYHSITGWPGSSTPAAGIDSQSRVTYTWTTNQADASTQYTFGASFPSQYVPADSIVRVSALAALGTALGGLLAALSGPLLCLVVFAFFILIIALSVRSAQRRKMQYLPPTISIEGHGIKRGLTAVEAAVLMQQPVDKIFTMILFSVVKKGGAKVTTRDPLKLEVTQPAPQVLQPYEVDFLKAFQIESERDRQLALQNLMVNLIRGVTEKMKGFIRKETIEYYESIIQKAFAEVQAADTPEVKSQRFDENMDWMMADRDFQGRSPQVFVGLPIFMPIWWGSYDPTFRGASAPIAPAAGIPGKAAAPISLPHLPGSDFAASIAHTTQSFAGSVVGNVSSFTGRIANVTNPPPAPRPSMGGGLRGGGGMGGGRCACACACAGCACACAGGGR
jgi:hypothetical protein